MQLKIGPSEQRLGHYAKPIYDDARKPSKK